MRASANLLRRAAALMPKDSLERAPLLADLVESFYFASDLELCIARLDELLPLARAAGDRPLETWAELRRTELGFLTDPRGTTIDAFRRSSARGDHDVRAARETTDDWRAR